MTTSKTQDTLFNLIKKLSKSEKKFFTTYSGFQDGEKIYVNIFKAMDKMKAFDEEKLLNIFKDEAMTEKEKRRKIAVNKNYLYNQILKSLRIFTNEKDSVDIQLYNLLVDVRTLRSKELFHPALKRLNKAKKIALEQEKLLILLEILTLEVDITIEHYPKHLDDKIEKLYEATDQTLRQIQEYLQLKELDKNLFIYIRLRKKAPKELLDKVEELQYPKDTDAKFRSFYAELHYYKVRASYYLIKGKLQEAAHFRLKALNMWRNHEKIREKESHQYKLEIANYMASVQEMGKYEELPTLIKEMEDIPAKKLNDKAETFQNIYFQKLFWYGTTGKYREAEALIPEIEKGIKQYRAKINEARVVSFYCNIILLYFAQGGKDKFKAASKFINKILHNEKITARADIKRFAWVLEIILHYELGSDRVLEHIFNTASNQIKDQHPFEVFALKHLKKVLFAVSTDKKTQLKAFRTALRTFTEDDNHFGTEILNLWINSKIRNCTIADILREQRKEKKQ